MAEESIQTTLEEARRCPTCGTPGLKMSTKPAPYPNFPRGTKVETFECRSDRCGDFLPPQSAGPNFSVMPAVRNRWAIQINPDGTIPPKNVGQTQDKAFAPINEHSDMAQRARDQLRFLAAQDINPGGKETAEIRNDLGYR